MNQLQQEVGTVFKSIFGETSLDARIADIMSEAEEIKDFRSLENLKEEAGDTLCSIIALLCEAGWDLEDVVQATLKKIQERSSSYRSLGRKKEVCIFSGSFDPPTIAHLDLAKHVLEYGFADEVLWMPSANHLEKPNQEHFEFRFEMCVIATAGIANMAVSDFEDKHNLQGRTLHVMNKLLAEAPSDTRYSFLIGEDVARSMRGWEKVEDLTKAARFIVAERGHQLEQDRHPCWWHQGGHNVIPDMHPGVSSSAVRAGQLKYTTDPVRKYIEKERLYALP